MAININILSNFNGSGFDKLGKELNRLDTPMEKLGATTRALAPAATVGLTALAAMGAVAIKAAEDAQVADARLANIVDSMGLFGAETEAVTQRLQEFADQTMKQTAVDDEVIKSTQAKLATFKNLAVTANEVGGAMDRATLAALDLAAAGFGSAETNAVQLGKALEDPIKGITALARSGVTFTQDQKNLIKAMVETSEASAAVAVGLFDTEKSYNDFIKAQLKAGVTGEEITKMFKQQLTPAQFDLMNQLSSTSDMLGAQNMVLEAIETQVGGTAAATATGSAKMTVAFGEMQESIGKALLPLFEKFVPLVTGFFDFIARNSGVVTALAAVFGTLAVAILAVNFALNANPIVKVITLIAALIAGVILLIDWLVQLYGGWDKLFKDLGKWLADIGRFFATIWNGIVSLVTGVINTISGLWSAYTNKLTEGIEVFSSAFSRIWNGLGNIARGALNGVINFVEAWINRVIGGVNDLIGLINTVLSAGAVVGVNFQLGTIPRVNLPQLAEGGIVMPRPGGVLANIAEAGQPEAVIPLNRLGDFGGGATYNVTVNAGMGADGNKIGQAIVDQILKFERSSGQVFARA